MTEPRTCEKCGARNVTTGRGRAVCAGCHAKDAPGHPLREKVCPSCGATHATRSGASMCERCRNAARKHPCATCGEPCDHRAVVCLGCLPHPAGQDHPNYKDGRVKAHRTRGYVRVKAPLGHPRAHNNYISEHVYVMEQAIGRYLLPGETVHHRNGVKDDNRPENLELWAKGQPAGQRAVDLLAWAREIIARYEPLEGTLGAIPGEHAPTPVP